MGLATSASTRECFLGDFQIYLCKALEIQRRTSVIAILWLAVGDVVTTRLCIWIMGNKNPACGGVSTGLEVQGAIKNRDSQDYLYINLTAQLMTEALLALLLLP